MAAAKKSTFVKGLGTPVSKLPRSLVEQQEIYTRGLIRFDKNNKLINTATAEVYKTLDEAIKGTARLGMSEVNIFTGSRGVLSPDPSGFGPLSDLTYNINQYLRLDNPEATEFRSKHKVLSGLEGKNIEEYHKYTESMPEYFTTMFPGGENRLSVYNPKIAYQPGFAIFQKCPDHLPLLCW